MTVAVFFQSVIGAQYPGAIQTHLSDVTQGNVTQAVMSTNAPNFALGFMMPTPIVTTIASTSYKDATSGLASSTKYFFEVAAIDPNGGTTTVSNSVSFTTDASSTQNKPETINVTWVPIPTAYAYAIYFSTTSATFNQYFLATSTSGVANNTYNFATSSGSIAGTNIFTDTHAFSSEINPLGNDWLTQQDLMLGIPTTSPAATMDIASGTMRAYSFATSTCAVAQAGSIFYSQTNGHLWVCEASTWQLIK